MLFRFKGIKYQHHQVVVAQKLLAKDYPTKLSLPVGIKLQSYLTPTRNLNLSLAQDLLGKHEAKMAEKTEDINDVLSGHTLSTEASHDLVSPIHEISANILKLFKYYMPSPLPNILRNTAWQDSVYKGVMETSKFFIEAQVQFEFEQYNTPIFDILQTFAAEEDCGRFQFSENDIFPYMTIDESTVFLIDWLKFQCGAEQGWVDTVHNVWNWLIRTDFKRGGFEVQGEPNSGKSFIFQALLNLFVTAGFIRPNKNCLYNWDNCRNKIIVCAEECRIAPDDHDTIEFLKDILCGNRALIREKHKPGSTLGPRPWMFLSNWDNFNSKDKSNTNPFNTRLYRLKVRKYPNWKEHQRNLHPYAWIRLFQQFHFLKK